MQTTHLDNFVIRGLLKVPGDYVRYFAYAAFCTHNVSKILHVLIIYNS